MEDSCRIRRDTVNTELIFFGFIDMGGNMGVPIHNTVFKKMVNLIIKSILYFFYVRLLVFV